MNAMNGQAPVKGLALSQKYYEAFGKDAIDAAASSYPGIKPACGLVGEGSQCFGFDDEISQDHDFAPGFCVWLSDEDFETAGKALAEAYENLPREFLGFSRSNIIQRDRLGIMTIRGFYSRFTGCAGTEDFPGLPQSNWDWFLISEHALAAAVNGRVFRDDSGAFSKVRDKLLAFYPEDVRRKKIAARAAVMAQAGQYNLLRLIKRGEPVAAMISAGRFAEAALSMVYLLNKRYAPFYKWSYRGLSQLDILAEPAKKLIGLPELLGHMEDKTGALETAFHITEEICALTAAELRRQGLSASNSDFLQDHLADIMNGIADPALAGLPPMTDCAN